MINEIASTIFIIFVIILFAVTLFFAYLWWQSRKQPPAHGLIIEKYYVCNKNRILHGGIFGKGPTRKFSEDNEKSWCWRSEWEEISREKFKELATEWYGVDWSKETPYWKND